MDDSLTQLLRQIPAMNKILDNSIWDTYNKKRVKKSAEFYLATLKADILSQKIVRIPSLESILHNILSHYQASQQNSLIPLINATGILLHTNLGRSPLGKDIVDDVNTVLTSYNNLEFNLQEGIRGERYTLVKEVFKSLLNSEHIDVLIVNNNASAVFLVLNTFAQNKEVIISRGELVEIGGSFRIPEVMRHAGAILKEVGTTNKTHLKDYVSGISPQTAIIAKIHQSNYCLQGFVQEVSIQELITLAKEYSLLDYYDIGSGLLYSPKALKGLHSEPIIQDIVALNPSLLSFSGDKLLGGPQAGIIVGQEQYIHTLKQNQLLRMLRVDKITLSILEATLQAYLQEDYQKIPILAMLECSLEELRKKAEGMLRNLPKHFWGKIIKSSGFVGGGSLPQVEIPSYAIALSCAKWDIEQLKEELRKQGVIVRITQKQLLLDMRTLLKDDEEKIIKILYYLAEQ
ncbi:L-seryl-tRNA(Sec) selenium transferase [Helicobacter monodelphidis]|uniref:L-seryl-tRNA(Sec) selenium transferase n=1 Tax=Helicobacter sp. 15-1451 TaxID=2004995 RepID=UPI000DCDF9DD|nr:L-seryl-tRNA(Sec) selenium transferase [Helicobacter sp. 15-1451]RAX57008.1 L-seryl-tRNA(Sec) selenium transferase [Helicobacter sp. 15-1451]